VRIRPARGLVRWWLQRTGYAGITLPPCGIYILASRLTDVRLRRHEIAHWAQYERMGALRFYAVYLWHLVRVGYDRHPMEIEARAAEGVGPDPVRPPG
jgi:hypothetical protein